MSKMPKQRYPSDLTDEEWEIIKPLIPDAKPGGRHRSVDIREILNGIFYLNRSGCAWRLLPKDFGPWSTVYDYYRKWTKNGTWERLHTTLREELRNHKGKQSTPTAAIIDSQSVKTTNRGGVSGCWKKN